MIGTNIRSVRHLFRVSDTSLRTVLVKFKENAWDFCKVIKMPKESSFGETLIIFNNFYRQAMWSYDGILTSNDFKKYCNQDDVIHSCSRVMTMQMQDIPSFVGYFQEIIMLPQSFDKDYEKFIKENNKMVNGLSMKYGFNLKESRAKRLYMFSDGSKNFFQWAVTAYYQNHVDMTTIKNILLWNESYKQLAKELSKGTITAYTSRDSIPSLLMELDALRKEKRISDSINSFNTAQKKMLKENKLSEDDKQALWRLSRLSDTKRLNFIKKMSSVTDFNELTRQLRFVTSVHFSWDKESFMDFINNVEGIKYEKIYENDKVILVKVLDYETIKQLGKTTNWCISKNKQYWNNYIEHHNGMTTQYMIFDFSKLEDDKLSIVGFTTTHNKGITSAHNFINDNLMGNAEGEQILLNSFIDNLKDVKNIYTILADDGIDITLVVQYDAPSYKWDENGLMDYLYECVNPENVDVISKKDGKIALSVMDENIRYFLGDAYHDNISSDYWGLQHLIFIDFNKSIYDINKLQFAIIEEGNGDEDYCIGLFNERSLNTNCNFDSKLIEFGLPYNTIRRTNDPYVRLKNAIYSFNTPMIEACLKEADKGILKSMLTQDISGESMYEMILRTLRQYMSFDYLYLLYDNGMTLSDIMKHSFIADMVKQLTYDLRNIARTTERFNKLQVVSDEDIENFFNKSIRRREDAKYVGTYVAIKKILESEAAKASNGKMDIVYTRILMWMSGDGRHADIYEQIIDLFKDKINFQMKNDGMFGLAKYAVFFGSDTIKRFVEDKAKTSSPMAEYLQQCKKDYERYEMLSGKKKKPASSAFAYNDVVTVTIG